MHKNQVFELLRTVFCSNYLHLLLQTLLSLTKTPIIVKFVNFDISKLKNLKHSPPRIKSYLFLPTAKRFDQKPKYTLVDIARWMDGWINVPTHDVLWIKKKDYYAWVLYNFI
jgi:hypothetical protein